MVRVDNQRAIDLYRRCGFEIEGTLRHYLVVDGAEYDALQMARLAPGRATTTTATTGEST